VNRMSRNRLPRVMKHYCPTGRRNHGRPLKRLLDMWDRNESTSGPTAWQIYDDMYIYIYIYIYIYVCVCVCVCVCSRTDSCVRWIISSDISGNISSWISITGCVTCKSAWVHDACKDVSKFVSPLFNLIFIHASLEALLADTNSSGTKTTDNGFTSS